MCETEWEDSGPHAVARPVIRWIGGKVRVREDYELVEFRGLTGTVEQEYIHPEEHILDIYAILGVRFDDGRYELFWRHEVEAAE